MVYGIWHHNGMTLFLPNCMYAPGGILKSLSVIDKGWACVLCRFQRQGAGLSTSSGLACPWLVHAQHAAPAVWHSPVRHWLTWWAQEGEPWMYGMYVPCKRYCTTDAPCTPYPDLRFLSRALYVSMYNYQGHGADEGQGPTFLLYGLVALKVSILVHRADRQSELLLIRLVFIKPSETRYANGMLSLPPQK